MLRIAVCMVALLSLEFGSELLSPCFSQQLRLRPRSAWDGADSGPPRQGYVPGVEQKTIQQDQAVLRQWQRSEALSASTRVTPQNMVKSVQMQIQQAQSTGDYARTANGYAKLAETLSAPGIGQYVPELNVWDCYKKELSARMDHIKQAHQYGDAATENAEWNKVQLLAYRLYGHEPQDPQWCFLEGLSYFHFGAGSYSNAKEWLTRCMNMPGCRSDLQASCKSTLAAIGAEEQRAVEIAARRRQAEVDAKNRPLTLTKGNRNLTISDGSSKIVIDDEAISAVQFVKLMGEADRLNDERKFDQAIAKIKQAIVVKPSSADAHLSLGVAYVGKGDSRQAEQSFRAATRLNPRNARAWFNLAGSLELLNKKSEARDAYIRARDLHDPTIQNLVEKQLAALGR